jgi:membrane protein YdbS with pleckstrin-like domain
LRRDDRLPRRGSLKRHGATGNSRGWTPRFNGFRVVGHDVCLTPTTEHEATLSYIDGNLIAGERVVYRTRLHWLVLLPPSLIVVIVLLPLCWYLAQGDKRDLAWIPLVLAVLIVLPAIVKRQSSDFAVTNKRVMMKSGVFTTHSVELLLNKVEAIGVDQSFVGRLFGYGDIVVTGSGGTHEAFSNIQGPLEFRRAVQSVSDPGAQASSA